MNAAFESKPGQSTCLFPMPFRKKASIVIRSLSGAPGHLTVDYSLEQRPLPDRTLYFHAQYHETESTLGYSQYSVLQAQGEGLFVGMNLFDITRQSRPWATRNILCCRRRAKDYLSA